MKYLTRYGGRVGSCLGLQLVSGLASPCFGGSSATNGWDVMLASWGLETGDEFLKLEFKIIILGKNCRDNSGLFSFTNTSQNKTEPLSADIRCIYLPSSAPKVRRQWALCVCAHMHTRRCTCPCACTIPQLHSMGVLSQN